MVGILTCCAAYVRTSACPVDSAQAHGNRRRPQPPENETIFARAIHQLPRGGGVCMQRAMNERPRHVGERPGCPASCNHAIQSRLLFQPSGKLNVGKTRVLSVTEGHGIGFPNESNKRLRKLALIKGCERKDTAHRARFTRELVPESELPSRDSVAAVKTSMMLSMPSATFSEDSRKSASYQSSWCARETHSESACFNAKFQSEAMPAETGLTTIGICRRSAMADKYAFGVEVVIRIREGTVCCRSDWTQRSSQGGSPKAGTTKVCFAVTSTSGLEQGLLRFSVASPARHTD